MKNTYIIKYVRGTRITLCLNERDETVVRAPYGVSRAQIDRFVEAHLDWLERTRNAHEKTRISLADGETVTLFGIPTKIGKGEGALFLPERGRRDAFLRFLDGLTEQVMSSVTKEIASAYGFTYSKVKSSRGRSRWGSCRKDGLIRYSVYMAFLPIELSRAIAVHELCHTRVFAHGRAFWHEVEKVIPNYRALNQALKKYEYVLYCLPVSDF